jgi:nucleoside-diphosphate-sugar epimerase
MTKAHDLALVTGAPGWLGTRLVRTLLDGLDDHPALREPPAREVRCLVHAGGADTSELAGAAITFGDLRDRTSLDAFVQGARGATLFHCAGLVHPRRRVRELFEVNADGTASLLRAARDAGVARVIYMSSNSAVGVSRDPSTIFDESTERRPYLAYGESKKLAEDHLTEADARGDLETVIIRSPWFYGPGQPPRQSLFLRMVREGRAPLLGRGDQLRSMAYVDNICQGMLLAARVPAARGRTYWIADDTPYRMSEIVTTIERALEAEGLSITGRRVRLPALVGDVAEACDRALQRAGLYQTKLHVLGEMNKTIACSITRARAELTYAPQVSLYEGMRRSIRWMIARGESP